MSVKENPLTNVVLDSERKGFKLMEEGDERITNGRNEKEDMAAAIQCYYRAARFFRMARKWGNAGEAYDKAADLNIKLGCGHDAATHFIEAADCFKKSDPKGGSAVACLEKAIEQYVEMGKYSMAAKYHQLISELFETDGDLEKTTYHKQAAEHYREEVSKAAAEKAKRLSRTQISV